MDAHIQRLLILARVTHYRHEGRLYAYTPYAREIELWADLFPEVLIAGTCREEAPPGDCMAFSRTNIRICPVSEAGGNGLRAKFVQLLMLPKIVAQVVRYLRQADAVHARCPCDLGLLGLVLGPLFSRYLIAKYATQWKPFPGEPLAWRLQRILLKSGWWRGPVTVYGRWPEQPAKIVPFFSSALTVEQLVRARRAARQFRCPDRLRVLFVGRLSKAKNVDVLLQAIADARTPGCELRCTVVGEGPERGPLQQVARRLGLEDRIRFTGGLPFERVLALYENSDALVLVSDVEGWPKAVAEGMAFGLVCVASERGLAPQMLAEGRGFVVPPRDVTRLQSVLERIAQDRRTAEQMGSRAAAWAQQFSLEALRENLRQIMHQHWAARSPSEAVARFSRNRAAKAASVS